MSYLKEFEKQVANNNYASFLKLWEEYCQSDEVDPEELKSILQISKEATFASNFGRYMEQAVPLWQQVKDTSQGDAIIQLIVDIQTSNTEQFYDLSLNYIKEKFPEDPQYNDKIRLVGLRSRENFQGALRNYTLLSHLKKGNFVFHTGGWGVGEVMDVSYLREQVGLEFEFVAGSKDISFASAFKTLIPLEPEHFLAMRFSNPDLLEKKAKQDPTSVIRILLKDLGSKTASEIKDELVDLVIPAGEWNRWWQSARAKMRKDTLIEAPEDLGTPFKLRSVHLAHEEKLHKALEAKPEIEALIEMVNNFMRDFPETLKNSEFKASLQNKLTEILSFQEITNAQELQIRFFLQDLGAEETSVKEIIEHFKSIEEILAQIELPSLKKRILVEARKYRADWKDIFLSIFLIAPQNSIRDYILNELLAENELHSVQKKLEELLLHPGNSPDVFLWYFQKLMPSQDLPLSDTSHKHRFFESLLMLLSYCEQTPAYKEMVKKIHAILTGRRYAIVRQMMQESSIELCQEFLLLATKCHSLSDHDIKIFHSLAEVVHPSLAKLKKWITQESSEDNIIWTTDEGYRNTQKRIQQLATVETVENAKEIEEARALGDLRENAEFKSALEKRAKLQSEIQSLSNQLNLAQVISKDMVTTDRVGVGSVVACKTKEGKKVTYTLLGPWDADPEKNIISFQTKLAQSMKGLSVGDSFQGGAETYTIVSIESYFS